MSGTRELFRCEFLRMLISFSISLCGSFSTLKICLAFGIVGYGFLKDVRLLIFTELFSLSFSSFSPIYDPISFLAFLSQLLFITSGDDSSTWFFMILLNDLLPRCEWPRCDCSMSKVDCSAFIWPCFCMYESVSMSWFFYSMLLMALHIYLSFLRYYFIAWMLTLFSFSFLMRYTSNWASKLGDIWFFGPLLSVILPLLSPRPSAWSVLL